MFLDKNSILNVEQLDKLSGSLPIDFRQAYGFGGSLHCSTTDVFREGLNYFPSIIILLIIKNI